MFVIPYFHPVSYTIPGIDVSIHLFGALVALGIMLAVPQVLRRGEQLGLPRKPMSNMCTWIVVCGFIVSHVFDVVFYQWRAMLDDPWLLVKITGGISSFGGFLGAVVTMAFWCRVMKQPFLRVADATAYGLVTGWFFGRLGCFSAHDHPGKPTSFFLGVDYGPQPPGGVRHDLGLYEALYTLALLIVFRILIRTPQRLGTYLTIVCLSYGPVRFALDYLRVADERYFGFTPGQYASVIVFAIGVVMAVRLRKLPLPSPTVAG